MNEHKFRAQEHRYYLAFIEDLIRTTNVKLDRYKQKRDELLIAIKKLEAADGK